MYHELLDLAGSLVVLAGFLLIACACFEARFADSLAKRLHARACGLRASRAAYAVAYQAALEVKQ